MTSRLPWPQLLVVAMAAALLITPLPAIAKSLLGLALLDALHLPFFFVLTRVFHSIAEKLKPSWPHWATLIALTAFAALSEYGQEKFGRTMSPVDLANNLCGILLAYATLRFPAPRSSRQRVALATGAILAIALAIHPAINIAAATHLRAQKYPVMGDFEDERDLVYWIAQGESSAGKTHIARSQKFASDGDYSLEINAAASPWAGVHHIPHRVDQPVSSLLSFTINNPGSNFDLGIRVDLVIDGTPHRSNYKIAITPGSSKHQIPLYSGNVDNREQLTNISQPSKKIRVKKLIFHLGETTSPTNFFLDSISLLY